MIQYDLVYLSLGAGVQSSALLVCSALGLHDVPKADVAIFADTQNEPPHVYEAVGRLREWAAPRGIPVETVTAGDLLENAKARRAGLISRCAGIPLFTRGADGRAAPQRRQCTADYKIAPIERRVRELLGYAKRQRVKKRVLSLIGISADEMWRVRPSRTPWIDRRDPLVDALISRRGCEQIVLAAGLPMPRKSACVFCPYTDDARWQEMKRDDPDSFERACLADEALRDQTSQGFDSLSYVHRSMRPLREIDFSAAKPKSKSERTLGDGFVNECEGMCGV